MSRAADGVRAHPVASISAALVVAGVAAVALYLFQPWQLFVDTRVDESFPIAGASVEADPATGAATGDTGGSADDEDQPATADGDGEPVSLLAGSFGDRSHPTSGTATVYQLADGTLTLRIEDLGRPTTAPTSTSTSAPRPRTRRPGSSTRRLWTSVV